MVRVLSHNIHSGIGSDGTYDLGRIAAAIRKSGADIACLQEVEFNSMELQVRKWSKAHADKQPAVLAKASGLNYWTFVGTLSAHMDAATFRRGEVLARDKENQAVFGNAILSRFPILDKRTLLFDVEEPPLSSSHIYMDKEEQPRGACAILVDAYSFGRANDEIKAEQCHLHSPGPMGFCSAGCAARPGGPLVEPEGPLLPLWVINTQLSERVSSEEQRFQARQLLEWIDGVYHSHEGAVRPGFVLCGELGAPPLVPLSSYAAVAADGRWRDLWREHGRGLCIQECRWRDPSRELRPGLCRQAGGLAPELGGGGCCADGAVGALLPGSRVFTLQGTGRAAALACEEVRLCGEEAGPAVLGGGFGVVAELGFEG